MKKTIITGIPREYEGREQAYIKHYILKSYLQRLFMIIGLQRHLTINYVDCFAGPWSDETEDLSDTSIGISIQIMRECVQALSIKFNRPVKFRALYIEKNQKSFLRLQEFILKQKNPALELQCLQGDYTTLITDVIDWTQGSFTFFFVDPKGWKKIICGNTMSPLLKLPNTEFLINLMYDFANRAISIEKHNADFLDLLGDVPVFPPDATPVDRQEIVLSLYRKTIKSYYQGRSVAVPIERPGKDRVLYFLVYLTRHPKGIEVFKTEAETMQLVQRVTQVEVKLRLQQSKSESLDLFSPNDYVENLILPSDNRVSAKAYLLDVLSRGPLTIDLSCWANFLEETGFYPGDLQMAIKELISEKRVVNLDGDVSRRRSLFIQAEKNERWCLQ